MRYFDLRHATYASLARLRGRSGSMVRDPLPTDEGEGCYLPVFLGPVVPLPDRSKHAIYSDYCRGESVESLARRFGCTKASIGRLIGRMRARRIEGLPLHFIGSRGSSDLCGQAREQEILGPVPPGEPAPDRPNMPHDLPPYLTRLYKTPSLSRAQEVHLFRKMNYLKFKASRLRERLDFARPKKALMDQIERLCDESAAVKNAIISANLCLVVSIARHYVGPGSALLDLVSDGNVSLVRAVERFDCARGVPFRTCAARAIRATFARAIPAQRRRRDGRLVRVAPLPATSASSVHRAPCPALWP